MKAKLINIIRIAIRVLKGAILALGGKLHICGCKPKKEEETEANTEN